MATLRQGHPAQLPVQVASGKPFAPAYFDSRPLRASAQIPSPPERPYRLGETPSELPAADASTTELAAAARPRSPSYAPRAYDMRPCYMSGNGLY
jgi:hypothetical protein